MPSKKRRPITPTRIAVGISSCLLGETVRYDGGHKHDHFITGSLAHYFEFVPVCPEVAIGMGVPREPIRLVIRRASIHAIGSHNPSLDVTDNLQRYATRQARELAHLCGYIFKRGSPSCGVDDVKLYSATGLPRKPTQGIYAKEFMAQQPLIPCVDETQLGDPVLLEHFIQRVFVLHRWRQMVTRRLTPGTLREFHNQHKFIVMAHQPRAYPKLERLLAAVSKETLRVTAERYIQLLMAILARPQHLTHALRRDTPKTKTKRRK